MDSFDALEEPVFDDVRAVEGEEETAAAVGRKSDLRDRKATETPCASPA